MFRILREFSLTHFRYRGVSMDPWIPFSTSDIPNGERQVLVLDCLDVKANGRNRGHHLACHISKCWGAELTQIHSTT